MSTVLGRVVNTTDQPRGPDGQMTVTIPAAWIAEGATLEIELPRNVACALCAGGGCDACARAGAVSLRDRRAPAETVEVTLPKTIRTREGACTPGAIVLRIPERGAPASAEELPRGNLMLTVRSGDVADACVTRLPGPSVPPPPVTPELLSVLPGPPRDRRATWLVVLAVVLATVGWFLYRH